jgi:GT2 family glycosyltransferase
LAALIGQDLDPGDFEIIIADDADSPATRELVAKHFGHRQAPALRYVGVRHRHGPAAARNAGWRHARGEWIAFTDDDTVPMPNWLSAAMADFTPDVDAAWGSLRMPLPHSPTDYERDAAGLAEAQFVTANCFCRRAVLDAIAGFDERFSAAWREDSDLFFTLRETGRRIIHCPSAVVVHPIRPAGCGVSLRQQRKSQFNALLFKKHPELYRQHIPRFPREYYAMSALLAAALGSALGGAGIIAAASSAAWLALAGHFALRRLRGTSHAPGHVAEMLWTSACIPPLSLYYHLRGSWRYRVLWW